MGDVMCDGRGNSIHDGMHDHEGVCDSMGNAIGHGVCDAIAWAHDADSDYS